MVAILLKSAKPVLYNYLKFLSIMTDYGASGEAGAFQPVEDRHG